MAGSWFGSNGSGARDRRVSAGSRDRFEILGVGTGLACVDEEVGQVIIAEQTEAFSTAVRETGQNPRPE